MAPSTFQEEYKNSDQIFVGRVLRKDSAYEVYYLFQTISVYKGRETDTVTIRSGFGGPDCGIVMEIGQSYLIYARSKYTGRCSRTGIANDHPDVVRLTFLLDTALANQIGKSDAVKLNHNESVYMNALFYYKRKSFDFTDKTITFFRTGNVLSKSQYFAEVADRNEREQIIVLTTAEKITAGMDAVILIGRNKKMTKTRRRKLIKQITKK